MGALQDVPAGAGKLLPTYALRVQPRICPQFGVKERVRRRARAGGGPRWALQALSWGRGGSRGQAVFLNHLPQPLGEVEISSHREESLQKGRGLAQGWVRLHPAPAGHCPCARWWGPGRPHPAAYRMVGDHLLGEVHAFGQWDLHPLFSPLCREGEVQ